MLRLLSSFSLAVASFITLEAATRGRPPCLSISCSFLYLFEFKCFSLLGL
jgi:hypothetical protein